MSLHTVPLATLETAGGPVDYLPLTTGAEALGIDLDDLPVTTRILLEMVWRNHSCPGPHGSAPGADGVGPDRLDQAVGRLLASSTGRPAAESPGEVPFWPTRVLCQDHSGLPVLADLSTIRTAVHRAGRDPGTVEPAVPVDLVIDHSVEVDTFGTPRSLGQNLAMEYDRNAERYTFLRWAEQAFTRLRVVPPGQGIVHQVHLECLATVVGVTSRLGSRPLARPDTVVGTDSHTPMVNGLGVLGWGVGGIEATAAMLGQPVPLAATQVVGVRLTGAPQPGVVATDIALTLAEALRRHGVVGRFLEFHGPGVAELAVADRATLANMCPEYGATTGLFPVDRRTLDYLRLTRQDRDLVDLVDRYTQVQGLTSSTRPPRYGQVIDFDLATVEPCLAGPHRPYQRVPVSRTAASFADVVAPADGERPAEAARHERLEDGGVVIAAITSCTNTSNPTAMLAAGLLARNAAARGLRAKPWVKTSLAPGSRVVTRYLDAAGLLPGLGDLGFHLVGYGCTTCIGNSGPLVPSAAETVRDRDLAVAAVLSGNRNFEGRIHPAIRAAYLASPALVVAYALAGTVRTDLTRDPLGIDREGRPVLLAEIWPEPEEVAAACRAVLAPDLFEAEYAGIGQGGQEWAALAAPRGAVYPWDPTSDYLIEPPFVTVADGILTVADDGDGQVRSGGGLADLSGARALLVLGDGVTTDHISPAGRIPPGSPAGRYLRDRGVAVPDFGSYGTRRGNHEVLVRGTFANPMTRNRLLPGRRGGWTLHLPSGSELPVYEAALRYRAERVPLLVLAGRDYGMGSSRDWAAKGPRLLGVRAVLAAGFERIHRSNLVGMGIVPLQFADGEDADRLGLTGHESYQLTGLETLSPGGWVEVTAHDERTGVQRRFRVRARVDTPTELHWVRHGGVLPAITAGLLEQAAAAAPASR